MSIRGLGLAALVLPIVAGSQPPPLSFEASQTPPTDRYAVILNVTERQARPIQFSGFELAGAGTKSTNSAPSSVTRQVRLQGRDLVATGPGLEIDPLPAVLVQRLDDVWSVTIGAEVNPRDINVRATLVADDGQENHLSLIASSAGQGPPAQMRVEAWAETFVQSSTLDRKTGRQTIDGGVLVKLRPTSIGQAGDYSAQLILTTESF